MAQRYISQQMLDSRNYQMTSHFVSTVFMTATLQFKRQLSFSFISRFLNSHQII